MDAITMLPTDSLHSQLTTTFPDITFSISDEFRWSPSERTIFFDEHDAHCHERLLHEVAHAQLEHSRYERDIELIALERDAWQYAKSTLAPRFSVTIDSDVVEDDLDTYRDWLHARSTCPRCHAAGIQTNVKEYTCVACRTIWTVNQAVSCGLKRYTKKHP